MKQLLTIVWLSVFLFPVSHIIAQEAQDKFTLLPTREARLLAEALAETNNPATSIARLMVLLQEAPNRAKADAARVLAERGAAEAIPALQKASEAMPFSAAGAAARIAIIRIQMRGKPREEQAKAFVPLLNEPGQETQLAALEAIGSIGSPVVGEALLKFARDHRENEPLYLKTLVALSRVGVKEALPLLEAWVKRPFVPPAHAHDFAAMETHVNEEESNIIYRAYWRLKIQDLPEEQALQILEQDLRTAPRGNEVVMQLLVAMGEPGLALLRRVAQDDKASPGVRLFTIRQLGLAKDLKSQDLILKMYHDRTKSDKARSFALAALVKMDYQRANELVSRILKDPVREGFKRSMITDALWRTVDLKVKEEGRGEIEEATWEHLVSGPPIASVAAQVLRSVGSPRSVPRLITLLRDEKRIHAHIAALTTIGFIGDDSPETLSFLFNEMVSNENQHMRALSAAALARIGNPIAIPVLVEQAGREKNPHPFLYQVSAMWILGKKNEQARQQATEAIVKLKESRKEPWAQEPMDEALLRLQRTEQQEPAMAQ